MRQLTVRQMKFVEGVLAGKTAKAAYLAAGFRSSSSAAETNAIRLLKKPAVAAAIAAAKGKAAEAAEVTAKRVVDGLAAIGFIDIRELFREDTTLMSPSEWNDETAKAVASVEREETCRTTTTDGKGTTVEIVTSTVKVKLWDKRLALVDLLKYLGGAEDQAAQQPVSDPLAPYSHYTRQELQNLHDIAKTACDRAKAQAAAASGARP